MPTVISGTEGITTSSVREGVFTLTGTSVALDLTNGAIQLQFLDEVNMTDQRIIYQTDNGGVAVITPWLESGLTIEQIALKDVPFGKPFRIINVSDLPSDRSTRHLWTVDPALLTDGVGADYGVGSDNAFITTTGEL